MIDIWKPATRFLLTLAILVAWSAPAWAQEGVEEAKASYVLSYVLAVLCIGLGLFAVCRGTKRFKEVPKVKR